MNVTLLCMGKTQASWLEEGISVYQERLGHYLPFSRVEIPDPKKSSQCKEAAWKEMEGKLILSKIEPSDTLILLDERGLSMSSVQMASRMEKLMVAGTKRVVVVVGGPYGFSDEVYARAKEKWSLSPLTFSHQMVRLLFVEQLYRSFTIIKGEPYHHQ